jgi:hypothetical protein
MAIPSNIIQFKSTSGGEYIDKATGAPYTGPYYELQGSFFAGRIYKENDPEIVPVSKANTLLKSFLTAAYSLASGMASQQFQSPVLNSVTNFNQGGESTSNTVRYFYRQTNVQPAVIKETDEDSYNTIINNPLFQTTTIGDRSIEQAESQLPGIRDWLSG